jgi:hypothetical protein
LERTPDRLVGDRLDDLQLDELVGRQRHGPLLASVRRRRTGQGDQAGLGPAVELRRPAGLAPRLADRGRLQALLDEPPADPLAGGDADLDRLGDPAIGPGGSAGGGIGLEEDAGVGQPLGGGLAGGDEGEQVLAFLVGEGDSVLLHSGLLKG